jgi:hypothetical protein
MSDDRYSEDDDNDTGNNGPPAVLPFRAANAKVQDAVSVLVLWALYDVRLDGSDGGLPDDVYKASRVLQRWLEPDDGDDDGETTPTPDPVSPRLEPVT